jgi:uncharacterized protein (TIGR02217 family)
MAFHNVRFPTDINYGSSAGPMFRVRAPNSDSGADTVIFRWSDPLHTYEVQYDVRSRAQVAALLTFFMARRGPLNAFRFKDPADFTHAADHVSATGFSTIGTGDGSTTEFQLSKLYTDGSAQTYTRTITKPVQGTVLIYKDAVLFAATGYDVNYELGKIYFATAPANGVVIGAAFEFDVPVRFKNDSLTIMVETPTDSSIETMELIEVNDTDLDSDQFVGGSELTFVPGPANIVLTAQAARLQVFKVTASGRKIYLPPKSTLPDGCTFYIYNQTTSTQSIEVWDVDGATALVATAAANKLLEFCIARTASAAPGAKEWVFISRTAQ